MYNNQGWKAACVKPGEDPECEPCFYPLVEIRPPKRGDKECSGNCWERYICTNFKWGCYPKGNTFAQAYIGMKVFFVFKQLSGSYTIWGTTRVASIDLDQMHTGKDFEDGYRFIHFEPFEQLSREKWVRNLLDTQLVGAMWRQGRFRYADRERELYLERLISGEKPELTQEFAVAVSPSGTSVLNIEVMSHINEKLEKFALQEGRKKDDIVREAIAEWLRERGS
jgi:hypothetical protein